MYTLPELSVATSRPVPCSQDGKTFAHWWTPDELCLRRNASFLFDLFEVKLVVPEPDSRSDVHW